MRTYFTSLLRREVAELWRDVDDSLRFAYTRVPWAASALLVAVLVAVLVASVQYVLYGIGHEYHGHRVRREDETVLAAEERAAAATAYLARLRRPPRRVDWRACSVLVTGGTSGIGLEVARRLVTRERVRRVTIVGRDAARLRAALHELRRAAVAAAAVATCAAGSGPSSAGGNQDARESAAAAAASIVDGRQADVSKPHEAAALFGAGYDGAAPASASPVSPLSSATDADGADAHSLPGGNGAAAVDDNAPTTMAYDVVFCCAGSALPGHFEDMPPHEFAAQMDSNYYSSVYVAQGAFRQWMRRTYEALTATAAATTRAAATQTASVAPPPPPPPPGDDAERAKSMPPARHIVFTSSMAAMVAVYGYSAYAPSKYAVRGLAETLVYEGKPYGITVSVLFPPDTDTPGLAEENRRKPAATTRCSEAGAGAAFPARTVAAAAVRGAGRKQYWITVGVDGWALGALSEGFAPRGFSVLRALAMPIVRCAVPFYVHAFERIIGEEATKRMLR